MKKFLYIFYSIVYCGMGTGATACGIHNQRRMENLQKDLRLKRSWPAVTTLLGRRSIYLIHGIIKMQTTKLRDFIGDRLGTGNNCL